MSLNFQTEALETGSALNPMQETLRGQTEINVNAVIYSRGGFNRESVVITATRPTKRSSASNIATV